MLCTCACAGTVRQPLHVLALLWYGGIFYERPCDHVPNLNGFVSTDNMTVSQRSGSMSC